MQKETKLKLKKIAVELKKKHGVDCLNYDNLEELVLDTANKLGMPFSYKTFRRYDDEFSKIYKNEVLEFPFEEKCEPEIEEHLREPEKREYEIKISDDMVIIIEGGVEKKYIREVENNELRSVIEIDEDVVEDEEEWIWTGLFDYNDGREIIRIGVNAGCDLKCPVSVKNHFDTRYDLYGFLCYQLSKRVLGKIIGSRSNWELKKNIETLLKYKRRFDLDEKSEQWRLKIIRGNKNYDGEWLEGVLEDLKKSIGEI